MANVKPTIPLAEDDPLRQRYAELLAEAKRVAVPRLQPANPDGIMCQLAELLGAPIPGVGSPTAHAAAWHSCLLDQGLGELLSGVSKRVLTIFFLLCWKDRATQLADVHREELAAACAGMTVKRFHEARSTNKEDKDDDNDSPAMAVHRPAADDGATF